jgi:DNA-binding NarL/FixJ family response regulator
LAVEHPNVVRVHDAGTLRDGLLYAGMELLPKGSLEDELKGAYVTARHREVLQLIAEGRTNKDISGRLGISVGTVEAHRVQLMERLDIPDIAGLVRYAMGVGLVPPGT